MLLFAGDEQSTNMSPVVDMSTIIAQQPPLTTHTGLHIGKSSSNHHFAEIDTHQNQINHIFAVRAKEAKEAKRRYPWNRRTVCCLLEMHSHIFHDAGTEYTHK